MSRTKKGGAILVGYIPEVHTTLLARDHYMLIMFQVTGKPSDNPSALANHRARVYQTAYLEIPGLAIGAAGRGEGFVFNNHTPFARIGVFNILIAILDYEEVYVIMLGIVWYLLTIQCSTRATTTLGAWSKYPCPICLIPGDLLWDLSEVVYPRRK